MADDDLVPEAADGPLGGRWAVVALFLLVTAGVGLLDLVLPPNQRKPFGERAQEAERRRTAAMTWKGFADGSMMQLIDEDLAKRSNILVHGTPWYAGFLARALGSADDDIVLGRDGWLFLARRARGPEADPQETAHTWARVLAAFERRLEAQGRRLVVMPVPRRAVVCREFLPAGIDPGAGLYEAVHASLADEEIEVVDLRPVFAPYDAAEIFYRRDSHWNRRAQFLAARAIHAKLGTGLSDEASLAALRPDPVANDVRDLVRYVGMEPGSAAQEFWYPTEQGPGLQLKDPKVRRRGGSPDDALALVGTSFSAGENLVAYLRLTGTGGVFNGAKRGFHVTAGLDSYLAGPGAPRPSTEDAAAASDGPHPTLLFELLSDQASPPRSKDGAQAWQNRLRFLARLPTPDAPPLIAGNRWRVRRNGPNQFLADLHGLALITSGDGVATIELVRPPELTGRWDVRFANGDLTWNVPWDAKRPRLSVPLLDLDGPQMNLRIRVRGPAAASLPDDAIRVGSDLDHQGLHLVEASAGTREGTTRVRTFPVEDIVDGAAVHYRQGPWYGDVTLELVDRASGASRALLGKGRLAPHGIALFDLPDDRTDWDAVRVTTVEVAKKAMEDTPDGDDLAIVPPHRP